MAFKQLPEIYRSTLCPLCFESWGNWNDWNAQQQALQRRVIVAILPPKYLNLLVFLSEKIKRNDFCCAVSRLVVEKDLLKDIYSETSISSLHRVLGIC